MVLGVRERDRAWSFLNICTMYRLFYVLVYISNRIRVVKTNRRLDVMLKVIKSEFGRFKHKFIGSGCVENMSCREW